MAIILALLIIPTTITAAYISHQLSEDYALWQSMQKNVSLSFGDIDSLETEEMLPQVEVFFNDMKIDNNLRLSYVIDKAIGLNKEELGGYDHLVVTDQAWVDAFDVGIDRQGAGGKLTSIDFENLSSPLKAFLNAQLPLWTKTRETQPEGLGFYEFTGEKFLALPPNVGLGANTIQAKKPLVILVNNLLAILKTKGFLLYVASSGNVVFPDEEQLRLALSKSSIKPYVVSIDGISSMMSMIFNGS
jgi:hypothetical protein